MHPIQHSPRHLFRGLTLAVCILFCVSAARAQRYLGSIQGEVTDATGAKVPNVTVTAEEVSTHFKTTAATNGSGAYTLSGLNPGTYTVSSTAPSFRTATQTDVLLTAGQLQKVDFQLSIGAATETVTIAAESSLLDTGSANIATTLSTQEVTELPNLGRNPYVMATLAAGVINGGSGGYFQGKSSQFTNPFSGVAVQIVSAGNGGHNRLTLDGIPNDPAERFSGSSYTGFVPSPEAVQEVKVQSSIFDAQVGHGNGTVTNTVIRSGANKVHGAVYYAFRNTYLDANTAERVPNQNLCYPGSTGCTNTLTPTPRNNDQLSQTGFVFDGPVFLPKLYDGRDKTFFLVAFERFASHSALNYSTRLPTAAELAGDFSALCTTFTNGLCTTGIQLYDPNSPIDSNGSRTVYFANNNIASRITKPGAALAGFYPSPTVPNTAFGTNYYSSQTSYRSTYPSFITRVDQSIGQKNKLNAVYFQAGLTQAFPFQGFTKGIAPGGYGYNVYRNTRGGSLDDVHQFSSSMVLDSRFGLVFHPFGLAYPGNSNYDLSTLGISSAGLPYTSFPGVNFSADGYASLAAGAGGQVSENTTGSLEEVLTKSIRTHTLRIGFEGNLIRYNVQNPQAGFGNFNFDRRFTQKNYNIGDANSGDSFADLLLGAFSSTSYNVTPAFALQQIYAAPFIQDDWRATRRLTINLGLRWDYESPFTERQNRQVSNFCTTCASPLNATVNGKSLLGGLQYTGPSNRFPYPRDLNNFQPRLGVAFQAAPDTVFRAGFGIIYFNTLETPANTGTGFSQTTSYNNYVTNTPLNTLANPFPNGIVLPTGSSLGLATSLGQNVSFIDPNHVQPKSAQYSASVQQVFPGAITLQVAYVGARPTRLEVNHNINLLPGQYYNQGGAQVNFLNAAVANPLAGTLPQAPSLNGATIARSSLLLPFPEFGSVTEQYSSIGSSPYNALQIQVSKPMRHGFSFQGNFTWDKVMLHTSFIDNYAAVTGRLASVQDGNPTMFGTIFGSYQLPKFQKSNYAERLLLGGWQLNSVVRLENGPLVNAPGNVDIIGDYHVPNPTLFHEFNTCYQLPTINGTTGAVTYANVMTTTKTDATTGNTFNTVSACDANNSTPAFRQRIGFTSQSNSSVLNIRQPIKPLVDFSMFKRFIVHEGVSFEIRGEFFNVLNTPNYGGPNTGLGGSNTASAAGGPTATAPNGILSQANDPRIGQLTGRINF